MNAEDRAVPSGAVSIAADRPTPRAMAADPPPSSPASAPLQIAAVVLAAALVALPFLASGGVDDTIATASNTWLDIALTLLGAAATVAGIALAPPGRRHGLGTVLAMAALTALTALSILWSVTPDISWLASGQMLAYLAVFSGATALARALPQGAIVVLCAVGAAAAAVCGWALLAKVFPDTLAQGNTFARLQAPFGYWNALGVTAAAGLPCLLWLGARRGGGRLAPMLAAPALTLVITTLVLSYSRSSDLAAVAAAAVWFAFTPLRLRAAAVGLVGAAGAAIISAWALTHHALSTDHVALALQDHAGHVLGVVSVVVVLAVTAVGAGTRFALDHTVTPPEVRRRRGAVLIGLVALVPVVAVVGLAASSRGLTGQISHGWDELTSTTTVTGNTAGRVLSVGSSRPVYWHEALRVGDHALLKGVGALGFAVARVRWSPDASTVYQAHSFVFETFADLGLLGLLVTAALLTSWLIAGARAIDVRHGWSRLTPQLAARREILITLGCAVLAFGVQSTLDWTWYFPGVAVPVLIAAGWLAGAGPPATEAETAAPRRSLLDRPASAVAVLAVVAVALIGSWMQWRPLHSAQLLTAAENSDDSAQIFADVNGARSADPLSLTPLNVLATLYTSLHEPGRAPPPRAPPPSLGDHDLATGDLTLARSELDRVLALDIAGDATHSGAVAALTILDQKLIAQAAKATKGSGS
jgi:hypothetical protein